MNYPLYKQSVFWAALIPVFFILNIGTSAYTYLMMSSATDIRGNMRILAVLGLLSWVGIPVSWGAALWHQRHLKGKHSLIRKVITLNMYIGTIAFIWGSAISTMAVFGIQHIFSVGLLFLGGMVARRFFGGSGNLRGKATSLNLLAFLSGSVAVAFNVYGVQSTAQQFPNAVPEVMGWLFGGVLAGVPVAIALLTLITVIRTSSAQ